MFTSALLGACCTSSGDKMDTSRPHLHLKEQGSDECSCCISGSSTQEQYAAVVVPSVLLDSWRYGCSSSTA
jgi:hypothetical protein